MTRWLSSLTLVVALSFAPAARAGGLLAVLPLDVTHAKKKLDAAAQASLEEMLRDVATSALSSHGWTVLSGENTLEVLRDNGIDPTKCGSQSCHLAMAREIKAERFLSGTVQYVEGELTASIRLIESATGKITASISLRGRSALALRDTFEAKSADLFRQAGMLPAAAPPTENSNVVTAAALTPRADLIVWSDTEYSLSEAKEFCADRKRRLPTRKEAQALKEAEQWPERGNQEPHETWTSEACAWSLQYPDDPGMVVVASSGSSYCLPVRLTQGQSRHNVICLP